MTREEAIEILEENLENKNMVKHCSTSKTLLRRRSQERKYFGM